MHAATALIIALAFQDAPAKEAEPTLKPLCEIAKRLDEGMQAFLGGKDMKESFKNWDAGETSEAVITKFREDLAKAHVVAARTFGLELRLVFYSEDKQVYQASAMVHVTPADAVLCGVRGRESSGTNKVGVLPDKCGKEAKPFADAGKALLRLLKSEKELPLADADKISALLPKFYQTGLKKKFEEAKADAEKAKSQIAALKYDEVRIFLDEQYFTATGSEGGLKEGMIRGKLKLTETGEVTFRLSRWETK